MVNVSTVFLVIILLILLVVVFFLPLSILWRLILVMGLIILAGIAWTVLRTWANQATVATTNLFNNQGMTDKSAANAQPVIVGGGYKRY